MQLERDKLILSMDEIVKTIVYKYNKKFDEDLYQEGLLACVKGVDYCLEKGITNYEIIKASCIVRVRNALIDVFKHSNYADKNTDNDYDVENIIDTNNLEEVDLLLDLYANLDERSKLVYELAIKGYSPIEITKKINISLRTVYVDLAKIKNFLKNHNEI